MIRALLVVALVGCHVDDDDHDRTARPDTDATSHTDDASDAPGDTQGPPAQLVHDCSGSSSYRYAWPVAPVDLAGAPPWGVWSVDDDGARWSTVTLDTDAIPVSFCVCSEDGCSPIRFLLTPI